MLQVKWCRYRLDFRFLARTSREAMLHKDTYFIELFDSETNTRGIGECALFHGLSADDTPDFETCLDKACKDPTGLLPDMSAIRFGFETAIADLNNGGKHILYPGAWLDGSEGIPINGLIWMGDKETMLQRVEDKLRQGFRVLKLKIGGIDFEDEISILASIRKRFSTSDLELRLDANGSFSADNALPRIERLSKFGIHSLEQPVKAGQPELMSDICSQSPIDIALDEELIGYFSREKMQTMLDTIKPAYIILKPSLCGGLAKADEWIECAKNSGIGWWATSALESNIGLNAIAQWVAAKHPQMPQGLGTGELYNNNISSPLYLEKDKLCYSPSGEWHIPDLQWLP